MPQETAVQSSPAQGDSSHYALLGYLVTGRSTSLRRFILLRAALGRRKGACTSHYYLDVFKGQRYRDRSLLDGNRETRISDVGKGFVSVVNRVSCHIEHELLHGQYRVITDTGEGSAL